MANRQVATKDYSWYGENRSSADDRDSITDDVDMFRGHDGGSAAGSSVGDLTEVDASSRKRFTLPIEPTESLDKSRDYPPIITVDGRVDTDIDHLMEHPEEEAYVDTPAQDIPSRFPKPHVVRVIDGSLDDDIDNLMNHDGTMAHTLVDTPKNLNRGDLKEINSKKSSSAKKDSIPVQTDRTFNKITGDELLEDDNSGSELVPYFERNNSSRPMMGTSDADFCHLKENVDEAFTSPPVEMGLNCKSAFCDEKMNLCEAVVDAGLGDGVVKDQVIPTEPVVEVEVEPGMVKDKVTQLEAIASDKSNCEDTKSLNTKSNKEYDDEKTNTMSISGNGTSTAPPTTDRSEEASELLEKLLQIMTKDELEKRLGLQLISGRSNNESEKDISTTEEKSDKNQDAVHCNTVKSSTNDIGHLVSELTPETPMQDAVNTIKHVISSMEKDLKTPTKSESQKTLMVTALKVAGDSMTAAAKMADALSLLVKSNQNFGHIPTSPLAYHADAKNTLPSHTEVRNSRSRSVHGDKKKRQSSERQSKSRVPENLMFVGQTHAQETEECHQSGDLVKEAQSEEKKEKMGEEVDRPSREKKYKNRQDSHHKRVDDDAPGRHPKKDDVVEEEEEEGRVRSKHRDKSRGQHREEYDKKETSHHKRSKTPKDRKRRSSQAKTLKDDYEVESQDVKQRHKDRMVTRDRSNAQPRLVSEEDCLTGVRKSDSSKNEVDEDIHQWSLPDAEAARQRKGYFDQVVRRLQPFSPPRQYEPPSEEKQIIRAKLVGSCVDPCVRDSDFDSIEFNGNARMSDSTLVHYGDEQESD